MKKPTAAKAYLIDIEGVLVRDKRYRPVPGAVDWLTSLVAAGRPFCLVSNNTTHRPADLVGDLFDLVFLQYQLKVYAVSTKGVIHTSSRISGRQ